MPPSPFHGEKINDRLLAMLFKEMSKIAIFFCQTSLENFIYPLQITSRANKKAKQE